MKPVGHTKTRCKEPIKEAGNGGYGGTDDATGGYDAPANGDDFAAPAAGYTDEWGTAPAAVTVGGGVQDGW